ncbi:alpha/beta hydrolase [Gluconacetobacter azotocaptans]|uniref:alpha/beta fold hydrolase n=1 Tax=Gluconacetobacter azotocaptans TaxID=142834 RepID=UPI00195B9BA1|nr:alpha/beta hydrolase [Gluconacetobacter azotocaptans]MBM9401761.1 alpha/beta hydrolase [Gluconacetobacter azotocaptans]
MFFGQLELTELAWGTTRCRARIGGSGPLLVLLHGRMQSHAAWHEVAPLLAATHTVVCPDLPSDSDFAAQARHLLALATALGHQTLSIAGHGTGGHVGAYAAAAVPDRISRLAEIECIPSPGHHGRADLAFELSRYQACWFAQLHPKPESTTVAIPDEWTQPDGDAPGPFNPSAVADYLEASPGQAPGSTGHSHFPPYPGTMRIQCPVLVVWSRHGRIGGWYDPCDLWRPYMGGSVTGLELDCGYYVPEEAPQALAGALAGFFGPA